METEGLQTSIGFETSGVDQGAARVEKAFDRLDKAEQKAVRLQQARQAEAARAQVKARETAIRDIEKMEKDAADRRVTATENEYKRLKTLEKNRQAEMVQAMKINQIRAGINPSGSAASRAAGAGTGGHGGPHGGLLGGNTRMLGDLLDNATGSQGWVMKLRALHAIGPALGRMIVPVGGLAAVAALGYEGYKANSRMVAATQSLQHAMGEGTQSPWLTNPFTAPLVSRLPNWMQPGPTVARRDAASAEGMHAQSEAIRSSLEKEHESRGGFGGYARAFLRVLATHDFARTLDRRMDESFGAEERAQDKLRGFDARQGGLLQAESTARHVGIAIDPFEGELARHRFELQQHTAAIEDQFRSGAIGMNERHAGIAAARQDQADADRETRRKDQLTGIGLNEESRTNAMRRSGGNEVQMATVHLQEAQEAQGLAVGQREEQAAQNKIDAAKTSLEIAQREYDIRQSGLGIDMQTARLRGNADERARAAADAAQDKARAERDALESSKSATLEQRKQAALKLEQATTARVLLERDQASARARASSAATTAKIRFDAETGTLGRGSEEKQAGSLQAGVDIAREELRLAEEIDEQQQGSVESLAGIKRAQEAIAEALFKQKEYQLELARSRRNEMIGATTETAAMRLQNVGRGSEAKILQERRKSEDEQYNAAMADRPELVAELKKQQQSRETGYFLDKFYNADGTKKDRGKINREERDARIVEHRRTAAGALAEKNLGLINIQRDIGGKILGGTDPFTHKHMTAREVNERNGRGEERANADKAAAAMDAVHTILGVLQGRLPGQLF